MMMIVRRAWAALVVFCAMMVPLAAASAPGVLRYSDNQDIVSLNPFLVSSGNIFALSELTMAHFTRIDPHGAFIPELVREIPTRANHGVSSDGKTITWHLRRDVRWSDGVPFDAADVVYSVAVARDPANNLVDRSGWDQLVGVSAIDQYTVVFHLKTPYAVFLGSYFSTVSNSCILPRHILGPSTAIDPASAGADIGNGAARSLVSLAASAYNGLPVGIGPFRYTAFHRGDDVEMEANPFYWRGRPKLDRIVYKIVPDANTLFAQMAAGEVDLWDQVTAAVVDRVRALPGKGSSVRLSDAISGVFFNNERVPDAALRSALRLATDRVRDIVPLLGPRPGYCVP